MSAPRLDALVAWYEQLTPESLPQLADFYAADARFIDPFNDVRGLAAIEAIFQHMFAQLQAPGFVVERVFADGDEAMLCWRFEFGSSAQRRSVPGASRLRFDAAGRIAEHRDYWDPARDLYAHWPVVGGVFRWLARRLASPTVRQTA